MKTLIVPCAGRSSRFPHMKPKYLLTHPDGTLMVEKAIEGLDISQFDRIVITILREHSVKYEAELILHQIFDKLPQVELLVLEQETSCQAETVYETIMRKHITGRFVVKDVDNRLFFEKEIGRLREKSFLIVNDQSIIVDIIEKVVKSKYVCVGLYSFDSAEVYCGAYESLREDAFCRGEIYISHVISYLIGTGKCVFRLKEVSDYDDWGTRDEWYQEQAKYRTYFIDLDGVLCRNRGRYGTKNWGNDIELLEDNVNVVKKLSDDGGQIVITTCRDEKYAGQIRSVLEAAGIKIHGIVTNCNHARRVLINDFAATNAYPSCEAINIPRNGRLADYIN